MPEKSNRGGLRKPAGGRPPKPPEEKFARILITLPPDMLNWLNSQDEKNSKIIQTLISEKMKT